MLKQAVHSSLDPGEKILIPSLSWWYYKAVASEVDGVTVEYPVHERGESFFYDVQEIIEKVRRERPRIVLLASPNNPTGHSVSNDDLHRLLSESGETILILDEAYRGFSIEQRDELPSLLSRYNNLLILRTFSKFYALAGIRIGYACAGKSLYRLAKFSARYLGYNLLSEKLALAALDSADYYDQIRNKMIEERANYVRELSTLTGWKPYRSDANFLLVRTPEGVKTSLKRWLEKKGIAIKFFDKGPLGNCVRITVGTEEQNRLLLDALKEFARLQLHAQPAVSH